MRFHYIFAIIITFFAFQNAFSQGKSIDSLMRLSYDELKEAYFNSIDIDSLATRLSDVHLKKAKKENNVIRIADSYLYKSYLSDFDTAISYSDSIIELTKDIKHIYYPALGFMIKGYHLYNNGNEKEATDEYLKADTYAVQNNNLKQQIEIKQFVGGVRFNYGNYNEAIIIFKEQLDFVKKQPNYKTNYNEDYLIVLDDMSKSYLGIKKPDSALIYINEGIKNCVRDNEKDTYQRFLLISGNAFYQLKEYSRALDSLNKLEPIAYG